MLFRHGLIFTCYESLLPPYRCLVMGKSWNESEREEGRGMQEGGVAVSGGIRTEERLWRLLFCVARGGGWKCDSRAPEEAGGWIPGCYYFQPIRKMRRLMFLLLPQQSPPADLGHHMVLCVWASVFLFGFLLTCFSS